MKKIVSTGVLTLLLLASCQNPGITTDVTSDPAPPILTLPEATAKLDAILKSVPARPDHAESAREWENLHLYLRKAQHLLRFYEPSEMVVRLLFAELAKAEESLSFLLTTGHPTRPRHPGEREEGYYSDNDHSFQPFIRYLPKTAPVGKKLPLLVYLHGYSPYLNLLNWHDPHPSLIRFAEDHGYAVVAPFGRSNTDFQGIGEQDVLRVIREMKVRYAIDEDRVFLVGHSMGGMGAWTIGCHYPDLFAGMLIIAGRGDYYKWQKIQREDLPPYKQILVDTEFAASLLPNLRNLPVFCVHGSQDSVLPVEEGRHIVDMARDSGVPITYLEIENGDHWIFDEAIDRPEVQTWLNQQRRTIPADLEYVTYHPRYAKRHWIALDGFIRSELPARLTVRREHNRISINASGVRRLMVWKDQMPPELRQLPIQAGENVEILFADAHTPLKERPYGPVKEAFLSPFLFVSTATRSDTNSVAQFRRAAAEWYRFSKSLPRMAHETTVTPAALSNHNVFVFGEPENSRLIREILEQAPIRITGDSFLLGGRKFPRKNNGLYMVYRSPWNPMKLAVIQCGLPWGRGLSENHKYDFLPDYIVYTNAQDPDGSNTALYAGFFDEKWQIQP